MQTRSLLQRRSQAFSLQIIVESQGWQVCLGSIVRLQDQNVSARIMELEVAILTRFTQLESLSQVG
jgi:hypothetical protein